jgi:hypothetical protein
MSLPYPVCTLSQRRKRERGTVGTRVKTKRNTTSDTPCSWNQSLCGGGNLRSRWFCRYGGDERIEQLRTGIKAGFL